MQIDNYEYLLKFIIIGNTACGKTCLLHYFLHNKFNKNSSHTVGVEFGSKTLNMGNINVKLQIWDTAGQERFKSVAKTYYRGALGALIIYDITKPNSFESLSKWIKDARDLARPDISIVVIGNKSDLNDQRKVSQVDAAQFCHDIGSQYIETSAFTGQNVNECFQLLAKKILDNIESGIKQLQQFFQKFKQLNYIQSNYIYTCKFFIILQSFDKGLVDTTDIKSIPRNILQVNKKQNYEQYCCIN